MLKYMSRDHSFFKTYNVVIKKIGNSNDYDLDDDNEVDEKKVVKAAQWSYRVYPCDSNFRDRTDQKNDYMDYEPDENWEIEAKYQRSCKGELKFG